MFLHSNDLLFELHLTEYRRELLGERLNRGGREDRRRQLANLFQDGGLLFDAETQDRTYDSTQVLHLHRRLGVEERHKRLTQVMHALRSLLRAVLVTLPPSAPPRALLLVLVVLDVELLCM